MSGASKWTGVSIVVAAMLAAGVGGYVWLRPPSEPATSSAPPQPGANPPALVPAGADAAPKQALAVAELLQHAGQAVAAGHLVEPAGDNAVEFYLAALDQDAANRAAQDGLREMFPVASGVIEQKINAGQLDDATRVIGLLGKADPDSTTLALLRSKLELKKKQVERDQAKKDQDKALATNTTHAAAPPPALAPASGIAPPALAQATPGIAAPALAAPPPAAAVPSPAPTSKPAPVPAVAAAAAPVAAGSVGASRPATLVSKINPSYPPDAARKRQEGWVEVGFTVDPEGHVKDAIVVGANPARVFNDAALRAVQSWVFEPHLEAGKPAAQRIKSRIEFKL
jgi:protein TonB